MNRQSLSIALTGSGGSGVMTTGSLLLEAAARSGWHGFMSRSSGPQIRGGEAAAVIRLASEPIESPDDSYDLVLAIDPASLNRFVAEVPLREDSLMRLGIQYWEGAITVQGSHAGVGFLEMTGY